jgi:hypothetical protein
MWYEQKKHHLGETGMYHRASVNTKKDNHEIKGYQTRIKTRAKHMGVKVRIGR